MGRKSQKKAGAIKKTIHELKAESVCICVLNSLCVCVCVRERERERETALVSLQSSLRHQMPYSKRILKVKTF